MYQISVSEVLEKGWEQFKKHGLVLTVVFLVIELIASAVSSIGGPAVDQVALAEAIQDQDWATVSAMYSNPTGNILQGLVSSVLLLGFINATILLVRQKATGVAFDMWKLSLMTYVKCLVAEWIYGIIILIGFCLCIIPGIWLCARLQFAPYIILENPDCGIIESLKESWAMTKGNSMNLILIFIAQFFICVIGFILCCIGIVPAGVLCYLATAVAYLTLSGFYAEPQVEVIEEAEEA